MTYEEALHKYKTGNYTMKVPPVMHNRWEDEDWVYWIFKVKPNKRKRL
jgi:hypothetical protein